MEGKEEKIQRRLFSFGVLIGALVIVIGFTDLNPYPVILGFAIGQALWEIGKYLLYKQ